MIRSIRSASPGRAMIFCERSNGEVSVPEPEGDDVIPKRRSQVAVTAGGDHHILPAVGGESHWRRLTSGRSLPLPQFGAGFQIVGSQVVVHRGADELQAAGCYHRASHVGRAPATGPGEPLELGYPAQRY